MPWRPRPWRARLLRALPGLLLASAAFELLWAGAAIGGDEPWPLERAPRLATGACLLWLGALLCLLQGRARLWGALACNGLTSLLVVIDLVHHDYLGEPTSATELLHAWQLRNVQSSLAGALGATHALLFLDLVLALCLAFALRGVTANSPWRARWRGALALGLGGVLLAAPASWLVLEDPEQVFEQRSSRRSLVRGVGLLPYHLGEIGWLSTRLLARSGVGPAERAAAAAHLERRAPGPAGQHSGAARGANLILIQVESLHAFPLQARLAGRPVMPRLERFRRECLEFTLYDQTGEGATSDAAFMALQSLHPAPRGAVATRYYGNRFFGLPHLLRAEGYATFTAVGAVGEYWNMARMRSALGIERALFAKDFPGESFGQGVCDAVVLEASARHLGTLREPFFAFLVTLSSHHPYRLPERHRQLPLGELEGSLLGDYLQSLHYLDAALGAFLERLRQSGLLDRSLVVIYGDHEAWLGDTPALARFCGYAPGDELRAWSTRRELPLLLRLPGARARGPQAAPAGHLDLAPTILGLLGRPGPQSVFLGRDLTRPSSAPVVLRDGSFVTREVRFLNRAGPLSGCSAYDPSGRRLPLTPLAEARAAARRSARAATASASRRATLATGRRESREGAAGAPGWPPALAASRSACSRTSPTVWPFAANSSSR